MTCCIRAPEQLLKLEYDEGRLDGGLKDAYFCGKRADLDELLSSNAKQLSADQLHHVSFCGKLLISSDSLLESFIGNLSYPGKIRLSYVNMRKDYASFEELVHHALSDCGQQIYRHLDLDSGCNAAVQMRGDLYMLNHSNHLLAKKELIDKLPKKEVTFLDSPTFMAAQAYGDIFYAVMNSHFRRLGQYRHNARISDKFNPEDFCRAVLSGNLK